MARSLRNWARGIGRQLRSPRYAFAILVGLAYLALLRYGQGQGGGGAVPGQAVALGGSVFLAIVIVKWWVFGADRLALAFTPAEIQFLFPAPLSRRQLLTYKLVRAQRLVLVNVLIWAFLLRRGGGSSLGAMPYAVGLWLCFSTLFFHRLGVALTRDAITEHGRAGLARVWRSIIVLGLVAVAIWMAVRRAPAVPAVVGQGDPLERIRAILDTAPLSWVLLPFRIPFLPLSATSIGEWLVRLIPALAVLALHGLWIVRADRAFEEAAIAASIRREALVDRWKRHGGPVPETRRPGKWWIRLSPTGPPAAAIAWKNVTRVVRTARPATFLVLLIAIVAGLIATTAVGEDQPFLLTAIGTLSLGWAGALVLLGPQWIRNDLRGEMQHLAVLRTWPLPGTTVMAGQVFSSTIVLTTLEVLLGSLGLFALMMSGEIPLPVSAVLLHAAVALLVLSGLNLLAMCIQNGAALLYPSWVRMELQPGGIEQMGQHLLTAGVSLVLLCIAAMGPGAAGAGAFYLLHPAMGHWAVLPAGLLATAGLGIESFLLLEWLGGRFERLDPSTARR
jgi:hypothetical protein